MAAEDVAERGRFEGQVLARLDNIDRTQTAIWTEIKSDRAAVDSRLTALQADVSEVREEVNKAKGAIALGKAVWAIVSAVIASLAWKVWGRS